MGLKKLDVKVAVALSGLVAAVLVLMPFHAFLTVWLAGTFGHYTSFRLWKEMLLILLLGAGVYLLTQDGKLRWRLISYKLHWLIAAYALVQLVFGLIALLSHQVTAKALGYAWIINLRFLAFFLVTWGVACYVPSMTRRWPKWVLWPLAGVVVIGLLQYFVLPYDFFKHFGYGVNTIYPYETINHNLHHLRMMSTLRGANPLGAYLILALSLGVVALYRRRSLWLGTLLAGGVLALILSFSRSAWIGFVLSLGVLGWSLLKTKRTKQIALMVLAGILIVGSIITAALWNNTTFQDAVFHTDDRSTVKISSNQGHSSALKSGLKDLLHQPFGRGPGTAGPASVYNSNHQVRVAENYFVQVGQETGWIGLLLFVGINVIVARALWRRRHQALALGLVAALAGITFVNLLSHAWADDTLAYLWWGLAGIAIATELGAKDEV